LRVGEPDLIASNYPPYIEAYPSNAVSAA